MATEPTDWKKRIEEVVQRGAWEKFSFNNTSGIEVEAARRMALALLREFAEEAVRIVKGFARDDNPNAVTVCDLAASAIRAMIPPEKKED